MSLVRVKKGKGFFCRKDGKNPPAMWDTWVPSLGWEDPLEKEMATHSSILGEGNGNPLRYSCLENPMDGGAWWATVHG